MKKITKAFLNFILGATALLTLLYLVLWSFVLVFSISNEYLGETVTKFILVFIFISTGFYFYYNRVMPFFESTTTITTISQKEKLKRILSSIQETLGKKARTQIKSSMKEAVEKYSPKGA